MGKNWQSTLLCTLVIVIWGSLYISGRLVLQQIPALWVLFIRYALSSVILLAAGGACYIAGAIVYALRKPDPWPRVFGFHEIFHCGTVAGYACQMVAIYMVIVSLWQ